MLPANSIAQDYAVDESADPSFLYVLSGTSGVVEGGTLSLEGVPSVVYFSDRPARIAGPQSVATIASEWDVGSDSFAADPPNAVLSVLDAGSTADVVIELNSIELDGEIVRFGFEVIDGVLADDSFGPASLFVDTCAEAYECISAGA